MTKKKWICCCTWDSYDLLSCWFLTNKQTKKSHLWTSGNLNLFSCSHHLWPSSLLIGSPGESCQATVWLANARSVLRFLRVINSLIRFSCCFSLSDCLLLGAPSPLALPASGKKVLNVFIHSFNTSFIYLFRSLAVKNAEWKLATVRGLPLAEK